MVFQKFIEVKNPYEENKFAWWLFPSFELFFFSALFCAESFEALIVKYWSFPLLEQIFIEFSEFRESERSLKHEMELI